MSSKLNSPKKAKKAQNLNNMKLEMDGPSVFFKDDVAKLLKGKKIYLVGDSNVRAIYKDLIVLIQDEKVSHPQHVKIKMECSFKDDILVEHSDLTQSRGYVETRRYNKDGYDINYIFVTKCWPNPLCQVFHKVKTGAEKPPDMVIMCSMLWDISRYGPNGVDKFKESLNQLCQAVKSSLPPGTFLWFTQPPVGAEATAAFLVQELDFMSHMMRFHVMEANAYSAKLMGEYGLDVFDLHYYMCYVTDLRDVDATHWRPEGLRLMLNLLLSHLCAMWGIIPPEYTPTELELVKDITYDSFGKSMLKLIQDQGMPDWFKKMVGKNPHAHEHIKAYGARKS